MRKVIYVLDLLPKKKTTRRNKLGGNHKSHFKTRFLERVGERCWEPIYQELKVKVLMNASNCKVSPKNHRRQEHIIKYKNMFLKIVFDKDTREMVTLLS
jgi:hypothetical protein